MILTLLVALEFLYIMYLETVATSSKTTGRVFKMEKKELERKSVQTLFKNQGIYNGLIAIGLFYGLFFTSASLEIVRLLLIYIILVAIYGSLTSNKKIILTQGGLAILALISSFF
jgi:putative membrane protein